MVAEPQVVVQAGVARMFLHGPLIESRGGLEVVAAVFQPGIADQRGQVVGIHLEGPLILGVGVFKIAVTFLNLGHGDINGRAPLAAGRIVGRGPCDRLGRQAGDHLGRAVLDARAELFVPGLLLHAGRLGGCRRRAAASQCGQGRSGGQ